VELLLFLLGAFAISFSGAMQPGPVTATVITMGTRNRYAGELLAIGHGIIEFPLMVLIILGMGRILKLAATQIIIGLAGGVILLLMSGQMFKALRSSKSGETKVLRNNPVFAGIILSAGNPYFLIWWATVGLKLVIEAQSFGIWAFGLFALVHWLTDFLWFSALSWASFKGSALMSERAQKKVLGVCAAVLFLFGVFFIISAAWKWLGAG
jgi:threonine/homoserine/homoserine lactone efflux protein